ncbi:MAG: DUF58 domain-containing protein [Planctomycetaceae bacterium]|jgi:uncharacterized protein (DUF58 family)|nr:DUF58 domain-containing protein [Planctomycetaceae bacterium]
MNFFHPETVKRISRLDLRAKHIVDGFMSGLHQSRHFGNSVEFRQHRQYVQGDDLRSVDWKVWAKQDRLYVKQYEVDTNLRTMLFVDVSASMFFTTKIMTKYEYACTAAVSLAYLALRQQDAVGCIAFGGEQQTEILPKTKHSQLNAVAEQLSAFSGGAALNTAGSSFSFVPHQLKHHSLIILLSDLLTEREDLFQTLRTLRSCGHDVIVLHILDAMEIDFTLGGAVQFDGLELPMQVRCQPKTLRKDYLQAVNAYLDEVKQGCAALKCDYALLRTDTPLDAALPVYLSKRKSIR